MEALEVVESASQFVQLDSVQFQDIIERLEMIVDYQEYISNIQLAILGFVAVGCGVLLANIFSRYIRG